MRALKNILIISLIVVLAVWAIVKIESLPSLKEVFTPKKVVIENTPVIVKQVRALAQLVTVSMYEEMVVDSTHTNEKKLEIPLLPDITLYRDINRLVIIGKVTTHIGIDMQKLADADISGTTDSINIVLPAAEVLDAIINPSGVTVFIERGDWSSTAITNLKNKIRYLAIADAKSRGLLSQSENKARQILTDFFKAAGYQQVIIRFKGNSFRQQ